MCILLPSIPEDIVALPALGIDLASVVVRSSVGAAPLRIYSAASGGRGSGIFLVWPACTPPQLVTALDLTQAGAGMVLAALIERGIVLGQGLDRNKKFEIWVIMALKPEGGARPGS